MGKEKLKGLKQSLIDFISIEGKMKQFLSLVKMVGIHSDKIKKLINPLEKVIKSFNDFSWSLKLCIGELEEELEDNKKEDSDNKKEDSDNNHVETSTKKHIEKTQ